MLSSTSNGLCKDCTIIAVAEKAEKERKARIEAEKRLEEEKKRRVDNERLVSINADDEYQKGCELFNSPTKSDQGESFQHFLTAAKAGHAMAQTQIGHMYLNGIGIEKDFNKGVEWTQKAANQGYGMAESNLAGLYFNGNGVTKDVKKALELYQRASDHGDEYAQYMLGKIFLMASEGDKEKNAREMFLKAAENGSVDALFEIIKDKHYIRFNGRKQCLNTLKEEFKAAFCVIKKNATVKDIGINQEFFDKAIAEKRAGNYVKASRFYILVTLDSQALSSNVVNAWIKVLAGAGDVKDAIALGDYVLNDKDAVHKNTIAWELIKSNIDTLKRLIISKNWEGLATRCDELAGGNSELIKLEEIDVYPLNEDNERISKDTAVSISRPIDRQIATANEKELLENGRPIVKQYSQGTLRPAHIIQLLKEGFISVNSTWETPENKTNLLTIAIKNQDQNLINYLLTNGCNVNDEIYSVDKYKFITYPVVTAIEEHFLDTADLLLKCGADIHTGLIVDNKQIPLICYMSGIGDSEIINWLLNKGLDPNTEGDTLAGWKTVPIFEASMRRKYDNLKTLLKAGANPNYIIKADSADFTVLNWAVFQNDLEVFNILMDAHADPNCMRRSHQGGGDSPALCDAISEKRTEMAERLIREGANVNAEILINGKRISALQCAKQNRDIMMIRLLEIHGARY